MKQEVMDIWNEDVYQIRTISLADQVKPIWIILDPKTNRYPNHAVEAEGVLADYLKQPKDRQQAGIFIYSKTYAIPDTPEELRWMTDYLLKLYNNPTWRRLESELVEDLRRACEKRKIPLYVNLSFNLQGKWKVLNDPKKPSPNETKSPRRD
jgi:hypothetical protein